jgi:hypothetical protein
MRVGFERGSFLDAGRIPRELVKRAFRAPGLPARLLAVAPPGNGDRRAIVIIARPPVTLP